MYVRMYVYIKFSFVLNLVKNIYNFEKSLSFLIKQLFQDHMSLERHNPYNKSLSDMFNKSLFNICSDNRY